MLTLPGENDLAAQIGKDVDPAAVHEARRHLQAFLGAELMDELKAIYERYTTDTPYSPDAEAAGRRSLRNGALGLMCAHDGPDKAFSQFRCAANMTDLMAALGVLSQHDTRHRHEALQSFYEKGRDDHLLVDKWFALHAMAPFPERIRDIAALSEHEAFSLKNPNKVRALVGTFALANPVCFNAADGSGYRFVADTILSLDAINPQVAARLAGAFRSWRALEPGRRALAQAEIERIKDRTGLSRDTFEIVSKTLQ